MKKLLTLLIVFCTSVFVHANPIDVATAKRVAENYFKNEKGETTSVELVYKSEQGNGDFACYYLFSVQPQGFIIISGDDRLTPVLGYSTENNFVAEEMPVNVARWLDGYKEQIKYVTENNISATDEIRGEWAKYAAQNIEFETNREKSRAVTPLIATQWNQGAPYNDLCPGSGSTKAYTGCTATAMAQIMNYWKHPAQGVGSNTYTPPPANCSPPTQYPEQSADFGNTTYDWDNMLETYPYPNSGTQAQRDAVATLMYHCGVSVNMNYGHCGSGAWTISYGGQIEECSENALPTYFSYKNTLSGKERYIYTENQWISMLKTDLDAGRPVLYVGYTYDGGGHAFVCDGYNANDYFHFNWGWGGAYDGYFTVSAPLDFTDDQNALFGIEPEQGPEPPRVWEIGDPVASDVIAELDDNGTLTIAGTGAMQSWEYAQVPWYDYNDEIINVAIGNGVTTIGNHAFDDCSNLAPISIPADITTIGDYAFYGCSGLTDVTVYWTTPPAINSNVFEDVTLSDVTLHLPIGTQCAYSDAPVWQEFDIDGLPWTITASAGDNGNISPNGTTNANCHETVEYTFTPDDGYQIDDVLIDGVSNPAAIENGAYTFDDVTDNHDIAVTFMPTVSIDEAETQGMASLRVYPNPTNGELWVDCRDAMNRVSTMTTTTNIEIFDLTGKQFSIFNFQFSTHSINVSQLPPGVYILRIGDCMAKFVKE